MEGRTWLATASSVVLLCLTSPATANTYYDISASAYTTEADAQTINSAFASDVSNGYPTLSQAASATYSHPAEPFIGCCAGNYLWSAVASGAHNGTVQITANGNGAFGPTQDPNYQADDAVYGLVIAQAFVHSIFQVIGPPSTTPLNVPFNWSLTEAVSGAGYVIARIGIQTYSGTTIFLDADNAQGPMANGSTTLELLPNMRYELFEDALATDDGRGYDAYHYNPEFDYGTATVTIDPIFTLSADDARLYHFEGLPTDASAPPVSVVPEPPIVALLFGGWGLMIACSRRAFGRS